MLLLLFRDLTLTARCRDRQAATSFEMPDGKKLEVGAEVSSALAPEAFAPAAAEGEEAALPGADSLAALIAKAISGSELSLDTKKEL